ncbi:MAG: hypothetical protein A3F13_09405 [Gammaproteobacteria bacterium RIFCSPHIGHO2_12_FULL_40_19]|nr:MAG: hypothetical protein A3F13_09405 [Gammaproteobacteria bacterium RIFCSPHIGHO2_12_FULL_40_19]
MTVAEKVQTRDSIAGISFFLSRAMSSHLLDADFTTYLKQLFHGGIVNQSEQRAAWHTEFRNPNPCELVHTSFVQMRQLSDSIREKQWFFEVHDVVNIGIGGSDLGPKLICEAFADEINGPNSHFVSNLDMTQIQSLLKKLSPQKTLFIVTSKSFRTLETLENMHVAKQWLIENQLDPAKHMIAITSNVAQAVEIHQIPPSQVLSIPDWMGGRYSIWSAVGMSCAIAFGFEKFYEMHQGAHEMDQHFYDAPTSDNNIIQYALMMHEALLHENLKTLTVLPYAHRLRSLPDYLQQLFMESLGKCIDQQGQPVHSATGPIVFGGAGTNSQHSFQQLMMQGTHSIFADYILPLDQPKVVANCVTQVKTLREGVADINALKAIPGGKIANLFVFEKLNLRTLGAILAFYEHVVVTLAFLLNINPFDQFGVEHAKCASEAVLQQFQGVAPTLAEINDLIPSPSEILPSTVLMI